MFSLGTIKKLYILFSLLSTAFAESDELCDDVGQQEQDPVVQEIGVEEVKVPKETSMRNTNKNKDMKSLFTWKLSPFRSTSTSEGNVIDSQTLKKLGKMIKRGDLYWGMNPTHMKVVSMMKKMISKPVTLEDAINLAGELRDKPEINPSAWVNAVFGAKVERPDFQDLKFPHLIEILPSYFIPGDLIKKVKEEIEAGTLKFEGKNHQCHATVDETIGEDNGVENTLWFFREDPLVNAHHWYWHLYYPVDSPKGKLHRKGELFYYFHHSALARFKTERLIHNMEPMAMWFGEKGSNIQFGYHPHLTDAASGATWTPRAPAVPSQDIDNGRLVGSPVVINLDARQQNIDYVKEAIRKHEVVLTNGSIMGLNDYDGIDILGTMIEANFDSINPERYDGYGIHNSGHNIISLAMDPNDTLGLQPGVMGESSTAMRDIMFYRHHLFVDELFNSYKRSISPYKLEHNDDGWPLIAHGVYIESISVNTKGRAENELETFFGSRRFDLSIGLDFNRTQTPGPVYICTKHLDHTNFEYTLKIKREKKLNFKGRVTIRIFMGPRKDKDGNRFTLEQQRDLMFVLDTFQISLPREEIIFSRPSTKTPLTVAFNQSIGQLQSSDPLGRPACGCGWPHHMLLPKGTTDGVEMDLYVIATRADLDYVQITAMPQKCSESYIFCGMRNNKFPDKRPMGYPFDRRVNIGTGYETNDDIVLEDLVKKVLNSASTVVKIFHRE